MATRLVLLGTGTPNCLPDRFQQAAAVVVNGQAYVIDCGGGTVQRTTQAVAELGVAELGLAGLTRLFLTHLHPDHTAGLADFMLAPWVEMRPELVIYGPAGTNDLVAHLLKAYEKGIGEHRHGLAPINHPLNVSAQEYDEGVFYEDEHISIEAFRVQHGSLDAFGLRCVTADKVIVHSGDTRPLPVVVEKARGCDILLHEVYCEASLATRPLAWQTYHRNYHTSGVELAGLVNEARPGLLVLNHQLIWGDYTRADLMAEITGLYDGAVVFGEDLMVFG